MYILLMLLKLDLYMYGIFSNITPWGLYQKWDGGSNLSTRGLSINEHPPLFEYSPPHLYLNSENTSTMDGHIRPTCTCTPLLWGICISPFIHTIHKHNTIRVFKLPNKSTFSFTCISPGAYIQENTVICNKIYGPRLVNVKRE